MIAYCVDCSFFFDDKFRLTYCPHSAFPANDGKNNFTIHHDSYFSHIPPKELPLAAYSGQSELLRKRHDSDTKS